MRIVAYLGLITFIYSNFNNAHAYIDPVTGGIILKAILGFIAAVAAYCSLYYNKVKSFFKKKISKRRHSKRYSRGQIIFKYLDGGPCRLRSYYLSHVKRTLYY